MTLAAKAPEERRRRILQASIEVLRARGFSGTRVADIAAAAGTSPALVLYHFSSLSDVLVAALKSLDEQYYADLAALSAADPRDRIVQMGALAAEGGPAFGDWQLWLEVWVKARHDERIHELRRAMDQRWRKELATIISAGVDKGVLSTNTPDAAVLRLSALMDGLAVQVVLDEPELTPQQMLELWLEGAALELGASSDDLLNRVRSV
ncbi:MAG TPA: TetR family transcriptional regulator C-terminal domain-containing protein [Actinomycetes bacterium]|nr:TetR family transcriptional regulator C-terminal domain-containing protein [Actinomycetes bacterium]